MNGFLEMVRQTEIEDYVEQMDADFGQEIDRGKAEIAMGLLKDTLVAMSFDDTAHPAEHAVEEIVRAAATLYMLLQVGSPAAASLLAKELIVAAVEFNENIRPIILRMSKEMSEE